MTAISVRGLCRRFHRGPETVVALDDVWFDLEPGELTVAAGPSGSGKTTLLSILAGLERSDSGEIIVGEPLPTTVPVARLTWQHLAFIPQSQALLEELSVRDNVELPARLNPGGSGRPAHRRTDRHRSDSRWPEPEDDPAGATTPDRTSMLLEALEIAHLADRYPSHTSGGEQQRTAIARALRLAPYVLLGDEPTGHQDRSRVDLVLGILRQHAYAGNVVLISSHDEEVIGSADRVITLADGRITDDVRSHVARH